MFHRAHPRSRGENSKRINIAQPRIGSSPLTRGKHRQKRVDVLATRLIPAHAGKTRTAGKPGIRPQAHPRSRGENKRPASDSSSRVGSSPLTRGKQGVKGEITGLHRLIPAHAGKTWCESRRKRRRWAHPRSRGENVAPVVGQLISAGSSPLTRGKRIAKIAKRRLCRLIPAHAGKTNRKSGTTFGTTAHPRSRGENPDPRSRRGDPIGSSPLTRGKRCALQCTRVRRRLIPAHAGKTLPDLRFYCADRSDLGNP